MTRAGPLVIEIIERASTLRERLAGALVPSALASSPGVDQRRLDAWCRIATKGDAESFDRRLALDGLERSRARAALAPVRLARASGIPEWARILQGYIDSLGHSRAAIPAAGARAAAALSDDDGAIPFAELFAALADLAEAELATCAGEALARVSPPARSALRSALLHRLARVASPLLYGGFERHRSSRRSAAARGEPVAEADGAQGRQIYLDYVRGMLDGGILALFREYPVLPRLMATTALLWREATSALLLHLHVDRDAIAHCFAGGRALGDLTAVRAGLSDPHGGGRTVHVLTFASGLRLVYKPRGLGIDAAFSELLRWLALHGAPLAAASSPALAPRALDRGDHGWAEYLEGRECGDHTAVRRYYQRAGAMLALLHTLGSTDCHYENLMAVGEFPVLIDLETVLQPEIERADPPTDHARNVGARRLHDDSVLRTGMLPIWQAGAGGIIYDVGGLTACAEQVTPFSSARWTHPNTDTMRLEHRRAVIGAHPNMPLLDGTPAPPADHVDDIVTGFARMYEWLGAHSESLLAPAGPLARLARERVRFIARPSSVYDYVLRRSLRCEALRDGGARSIELDLLARGLLHLSPALWSLLRVEQLALEQLDIPIFTVRGDGTRVALDGRDGEAEGAELPAARSGLDVARSRLAALSPADLARQSQVIRSSFALRYAGDAIASDAYVAQAGAFSTAPLAGASDDAELLAAATEIAADIQRMALTDSEGRVTWITIEPISISGRSRLQATDYGIYGGLAGIAIFLAAAARCCKDEGFASLALRALLPLRERLHSAHPTFAEEFGLGGACGAASATYALLRAGALLDDDSLIGDALCAAGQITPSAITADRSYDVLYGAAGAIHALLALHRVHRAAWLLERASLCGSHLLANRHMAPSGRGARHWVWRTAGGRILPGFAHGAAGIAYALIRLHGETGRSDFLDAACDAVHYEDELLGQERGEGRETRATAHPAGAADTGSTWCRGAAGIGLARLGSLAVHEASHLRRGLESAIVASGPAGAASTCIDNLCCGGFGAIELLLAAGLQRDDPPLIAAARARASAIVRRKRACGAYRLLAPSGVEVYDPALYRGTAGIGYGLLRICHPGALPSLLMWE